MCILRHAHAHTHIHPPTHQCQYNFAAAIHIGEALTNIIIYMHIEPMRIQSEACTGHHPHNAAKIHYKIIYIDINKWGELVEWVSDWIQSRNQNAEWCNWTPSTLTVTWAYNQCSYTGNPFTQCTQWLAEHIGNSTHIQSSKRREHYKVHISNTLTHLQHSYALCDIRELRTQCAKSRQTKRTWIELRSPWRNKLCRR